MLKYKGIEVTVTSAGKFTAALDDLPIEDATFEGLQRKIDRKGGKKRVISLPVVGLLDFGGNSWELTEAVEAGKAADLRGTIAAATLRGVNRHTREAQIDGLPKHYELEQILADTPENRELLEKLVEAHKVIDAVNERNLWGRSYTRLSDPEGYEEALLEIEHKHTLQMDNAIDPTTT